MAQALRCRHPSCMLPDSALVFPDHHHLWTITAVPRIGGPGEGQGADIIGTAGGLMCHHNSIMQSSSENWMPSFACAGASRHRKDTDTACIA